MQSRFMLISFNSEELMGAATKRIIFLTRNIPDAILRRINLFLFTNISAVLPRYWCETLPSMAALPIEISFKILLVTFSFFIRIWNHNLRYGGVESRPQCQYIVFLGRRLMQSIVVHINICLLKLVICSHFIWII